MFELDPESGALLDILAAPIDAKVDVETYGICLYQDRSDRLYAFATDKSGAIEQWELRPSGSMISGVFKRKFRLSSQVEGCVADDDLGWLFVGEEDKGIWRFEADPQSEPSPKLIDTTGESGHLYADVEGLAIYASTDDGDGYLIASSQGNDAYIVYDRSPPHRYRGSFQIQKQGRFVGDTDGLDVSAALRTPSYPEGILIVQDGMNESAESRFPRQNFKFVSWRDVAKQLQ